jgi:hypothetical protein
VLKPNISNILFGDAPDVQKHIKRAATNHRGGGAKNVDLRMYVEDVARGTTGPGGASAGVGGDTAIFNFLNRQDVTVDGNDAGFVKRKEEITPVQRTRAIEELRRIQERTIVSPAERRRLIDAAMCMDPVKIARRAVISSDELARESKDSGSFLTGALLNMAQVEGDGGEEEPSPDEKFSRALEEAERVRRRMLNRAAGGMSKVPAPVSVSSGFAAPLVSPRTSPRSSPRASQAPDTRREQGQGQGQGQIQGRRHGDFDFDFDYSTPEPPPPSSSFTPLASSPLGNNRSVGPTDVRSAVANYLDLLDASPSAADSDSKDNSSREESEDRDRAGRGGNRQQHRARGENKESKHLWGNDDDKEHGGVGGRDHDRSTRSGRRGSKAEMAQLRAQRSAEFMTEELGKMQASFNGAGWDALKQSTDATLHGSTAASARRPLADGNVPRLGALEQDRPTSAAGSVGNISARTDDMFSGGTPRDDDGDDDADYKWEDSFEQTAGEWKADYCQLDEGSTFAADFESSVKIVDDFSRYGVGSGTGTGTGTGTKYDRSHTVSALASASSHWPQQDISAVHLPHYTSLATPAVLGRTSVEAEPRGSAADAMEPKSVSASIQDWISFSRSTQEAAPRNNLGMASLHTIARDDHGGERLTGLRDALDVLQRRMVESSVQSREIEGYTARWEDDDDADTVAASGTIAGKQQTEAEGFGAIIHDSRQSPMQRSGSRVFDSLPAVFGSPIRVRSKGGDMGTGANTRARVGEGAGAAEESSSAAGRALAAAANAGDVAGRMLADMMVRKEMQRAASSQRA